MKPLVVLLVDANSIFRQSVVRFLDEHAPGQIVVGGAANGGAEALSLATSLHPAVVLLGLAGSARPGLQLLPQVRTMLPETGIIVLGLLDIDGYRQAAHAAGADAFLCKDGLKVTLVPTIMDVARDRGMDRSLGRT
jgi:two-component system, NarL family, response regulator DevR